MELADLEILNKNVDEFIVDEMKVIDM